MKNGKLEYQFKEPFAALEKAAAGTNRSKLEEIVKSPIQISELQNLGSEKGESGLSRSQRSTMLRMWDDVRHELKKEESEQGAKSSRRGK